MPPNMIMVPTCTADNVEHGKTFLRIRIVGDDIRIHIPAKEWMYICYALGCVAGWSQRVASDTQKQTLRLSTMMDPELHHRWPVAYWPELGVYRKNAECSRASSLSAWDDSLALWVHEQMKKKTYRVEFTSVGIIKIFSWGVVENEERSYCSPDALPQWMQEKIAVLMILDPNEINSEMPGVGRRISQNIFWVCVDGDERLGNDTGTPGKKPRP